MSRHNFVVGDKCIILGDSRGYAHHFTSGEVVVIKGIDGPTAYCASKDDRWFVHVDDLRFIKTSIINLEEVK